MNIITLVTTLLVLIITTRRGGTRAQNIEPHRAVIENSIIESRLPSNLKNPFYENALIKSALARNSWFGPGERQVLEREADKVPRREIFLVLKHAGLLPQQQQQKPQF